MRRGTRTEGTRRSFLDCGAAAEMGTMPGALHIGAAGVAAHVQHPTSPAVQSGVQKSRKSANRGVSSVTEDGAPGTGSTVCAAPCTHGTAVSRDGTAGHWGRDEDVPWRGPLLCKAAKTSTESGTSETIRNTHNRRNSHNPAHMNRSTRQ